MILFDNNVLHFVAGLHKNYWPDFVMKNSLNSAAYWMAP